MIKPITKLINSAIDIFKHWFSYVRLFNKKDILDIMDKMEERKLGRFQSKSVLIHSEKALALLAKIKKQEPLDK